MSVPFVVNNDMFSVTVKGKNYILPRSDRKSRLVTKAISEGKSEDQIHNILAKNPDMKSYIDSQNNSRVTIKNGEVCVDGKPLYNSLADKIKEFMRHDLPVENFIRFVEKIENNPSYNSRKQLYDFLENKCLVISEDGDFLAYKSVRQDYMDWHSNSISNSPGETIRMDRNLIDDNPASHCSKGLHVGAMSYAQGFHSHSNKLVIVKVNPTNVVSVPNDHNCQKCRVCEYYVVSDANTVLTEPLYKTDGTSYTHDYDDISWDDVADDDYDEYEDGEVYSYDDEYDYEDEDDEYVPLINMD